MSAETDRPDDLQEYVKLMTDHQGNLRAFIVSLMPGSPDVADVLQETNATLWLKRSRFEHGTNFIAWSFKIARYEVMRQRDRTKRLGRMVLSDKLVEVLADTEESGKPDERLAALDGCMKRLTDTQRKLLHERYTPGHSLEQHSIDIGRSAGSLRMSLLRIREILKDCIEKTLAREIS